MESNYISSLYYWFNCIVTRLFGWVDYLESKFADSSMEIHVTIGIILLSVVIIVTLLLLMFLRSYQERKNRKARRKLEERFKALVYTPEEEQKCILYQTVSLGLTEVAKVLGTSIPSEEDKKKKENKIRQSLTKKEEYKKKDGKSPLNIEEFEVAVRRELEKYVDDETHKRAQNVVECELGKKFIFKDRYLKGGAKRRKRMLCQLLYEDVINGKKCCNIDNLHQVIDLFGLHGFLELEVDHGSMNQKMKALRMLSIFRLRINNWLINTLQESRNPSVRRQAHHAYIMSEEDNILDYYEDSFFRHNYCLKDEIELGYSLYRRRSAGKKLPDLVRLARLHEDEVPQAMFVRLMCRFKQKEQCSRLKGLFESARSRELIQEIARTWGYLNFKDGEQQLQDLLQIQPDDTRIVFMHALTRMGTGKSLDLLKEEYKNAVSEEVRYEALRCINNYDGKESETALKKELDYRATSETTYNWVKEQKS